MKIESKKTQVNAPIEKVYSFLANSKNIEQLLPQNDVKDFKGTETECSFKVQGGIIISLIQKEVIPFDEIILQSGEKSPFPFTLTVFLNSIAEHTTEGYLLFDGEVNAFLSMMVKKPLTNLFDYMSGELTKVDFP